MLWARDALFDIYATSAGPTNDLIYLCTVLWRDFARQYLPGYPTDLLMQGYHPELDPYYPLVHLPDVERVNAIAFYDQAASHREVCEAEARCQLKERSPDQLPRFEQLLDWVRFWGSAKNDRGWASMPGNPVRELWEAMCDRLMEAGLVKEPADIGYYTAEDLAHIAQTMDIEGARQIWQRRQHEYETYARLEAPEFLGRPAERPSARGKEKAAASQKHSCEPSQEGLGSVIAGTGLVIGSDTGIAHRIASLDEANTVTGEHVLLFASPCPATCAYSGILLSLMLRVHGMITLYGFTNTNHIAQIARECGVPIVQLSQEDMARTPDGSRLSLDGSRGTVTLHGSR